MRAPDFWYPAPGAPRPIGQRAAAAALSPAAALVALAGRARRALARSHRARVPVICVGNLVAGGAGKTPTVIAICDRLAALGLSAHILSRGYGGRLKGPHRVDPAQDGPGDVGDEPLLLAARRPVWIGADRAASAVAAEYAGAEVLVMDDGFQNPSLEKDLSIVVIDAAAGHGNGRVLPAGPLREPLADGFARADAAVLIGAPPPGRPWPETPPGLPTLKAAVAPLATGMPLSGARLMAFAGIGRPQKFFDMLRAAGAVLADAEAFPDHHVYSAAILTRLETRARDLDATLVTTEKDAVRLPPRFQGRVSIVPVALGFEAPAAVDALLGRLFEAQTGRQSPPIRR